MRLQACSLRTRPTRVRALLPSRFAVDNLQLRTETLGQPVDLSEILPCVLRLGEIDLIVIGEHGRTRFKRRVLRWIVEKISRAALCPVLTIGPQVQRPRIVRESARKHSASHRLSARMWRHRSFIHFNCLQVENPAYSSGSQSP